MITRFIPNSIPNSILLNNNIHLEITISVFYTLSIHEPFLSRPSDISILVFSFEKLKEYSFRITYSLELDPEIAVV